MNVTVKTESPTSGMMAQPPFLTTDSKLFSPDSADAGGGLAAVSWADTGAIQPPATKTSTDANRLALMDNAFPANLPHLQRVGKQKILPVSGARALKQSQFGVFPPGAIRAVYFRISRTARKSLWSEEPSISHATASTEVTSTLSERNSASAAS